MADEPPDPRKDERAPARVGSSRASRTFVVGGGLVVGAAVVAGLLRSLTSDGNSVVPLVTEAAASAELDGAPPPNVIVALAECRKLKAAGAPPTPPKLCAEGGDATAIRAGSASCAQAYYSQTIAEGPNGLGLFKANEMMQSSLDDLLAFVGMPQLHVADLETTTSSTLTRQSAKGEVVAVSIFAPKITNVSSGATTKYGWRKLVRILPTANSRAAAVGIERAFILLNYFQTDLTTSPFAGKSVNTQAILVSSQAAVGRGKDLAYWVDYGPTADGAKLSLSLPATFDGRFPAVDDPQRSYFVPDGCISCHGESVTRPLLNYFDTDHFEDRLEGDNDFGAVIKAGEHMFADEGSPAGCTHQECFGALRTLNAEMEAENVIAQPCTIEVQAASSWLALHETSDAHLPPVQRAIRTTISPKLEEPIFSPTVWTDSPDERELLGLLNRYCFRCHGSIRFNVFDKAAVLEKSELIRKKVGPSATGRDAMPTDRTLPQADQQRLLALMKQLGAQ